METGVRFPSLAPVYGGQLGEPVIFVEVQNSGEKAINLVAIELELPGKQVLALMDNTARSGSGLPYKLSAEGNARYWFDIREVARHLLESAYKVADISSWAKNT